MEISQKKIRQTPYPLSYGAPAFPPFGQDGRRTYCISNPVMGHAPHFAMAFQRLHLFSSNGESSPRFFPDPHFARTAGDREPALEKGGNHA